MATNYEKKLLQEIKDLKEGCVPKDILFAERSGHRREIASMEKQIEELKKQVAGIPALVEAERYKERECNERDYKELDEELKEERDELRKQLEDDKRQVHTLFAENEKLREELFKTVGQLDARWEKKEKALTKERNEARMRYNHEKERVEDVLQQLYGAKHHDWDCDWKTIASCVRYEEEEAMEAWMEYNPDERDEERERRATIMFGDDKLKARYEGEQEYEDK